MMRARRNIIVLAQYPERSVTHHSTAQRSATLSRGQFIDLAIKPYFCDIYETNTFAKHAKAKIVVESFGFSRFLPGPNVVSYRM